MSTWESLGGSPAPATSPGLYHVAIVYPTRSQLAQALLRLVGHGVSVQGAADHGVSESLCLADPDGNGIELYCDRDRTLWPRTPEGSIVLVQTPGYRLAREREWRTLLTLRPLPA